MRWDGFKKIARNISSFVGDCRDHIAADYKAVRTAVTDTAKNFAAKISAFGSKESKEIAHEARILEEGLIHMGSAPPDIKADFNRDIATCAVETSLALAESVEFEVTCAVATVEAAEKIVNTPDAKLNFGEVARDFGESLASSVMAAAHSAMNAVVDVERSGEDWELKHKSDQRSNKDTGAPSLPAPV